MATSPAILHGLGDAGSGAPRWSDLVFQWRPDPLTLALLAAAAVGYAWYRTRARRAGLSWPARRDAIFGVGVVAAIWVTSGPPQARGAQLEWVWMAQLLALLLVLPLVILAGRPIQLAAEVSGGRAPISRIVASRPVRVLSHPLVGPALVPVTFLVLLYGGVGQAAASSAPAGWLVHAVLLLLGAAIALPLVDGTGTRSSLAVGMALAVGFLELILDVFPGVALRLAGNPVIGYFASHTPPWAGGWLYQQHEAGGLLWIALEVLDLPFLVFLAVRWVRVDTAEAARLDALLDAESAAAAPRMPPGTPPGTVDGTTEGMAGTAGGATVTGTGASVTSAMSAELATAMTAETAGSEGAVRTPEPDGAPAARSEGRGSRRDRPWFLDDPQLRDRYRF